MRAWIALFLLPLAACTTGGHSPMTYGTDIQHYLPAEANMLAAAGGVQLIVLGSPFGADAREATVATIAKKIEDGSHGAPFHVLPIEEGAELAHARVVIALNANTYGSRLCGELPAERNVGGQASQIELAAAFCRGEKTISSTNGRAGEITGASDPIFQRLISQAAGEIFPSASTIINEQDRRREPGEIWILTN